MIHRTINILDVKSEIQFKHYIIPVVVNVIYTIPLRISFRYFSDGDTDYIVSVVGAMSLTRKSLNDVVRLIGKLDSVIPYKYVVNRVDDTHLIFTKI